jgi:hypothetical protein
MNESPREKPVDNFIDEIVDGSLCPGELRLALARLDHEPDGWKRCTLAFLEAQCWREAFRALDGPPVSQPERGYDSIRPAPAKFDRPRTRWWQSVAAAGIIAASFALGWLSHVSGPRDVAGPPLPISSSPVVAEVPRDLPSEPALPASAITPSAASPDSRFVVDRSPRSSGELVQTVARVRIGPEGAGATVPILAGPGLNGDWLESQPPPLSEYEQVVLQRHGYQIDQRRRLLIATLADGRRVSVPIDQVEIRYTGSNPL